MSDTARLVVELNERSHQALRRRCEVEALNKTTIVNRALQIYDTVRTLAEDGGSVQFTYPDGRSATVVFL